MQAALAFARDRLGLLERLASRGDVVRFHLLAQPVVLLTHPDLARAMLVAAHASTTKSPVLRQARVVLGEGLLTAEGRTHRRHRRLVQPAFHRGRIESYAATMVGIVAQEAGAWSAHRPLDAAAAMHRLALHIAGSTLFGADTRDRAAEVRRAVEDLLAAYPTAGLPFGEALRRLPLPPMRRLHAGLARIDGLVAELIAERRVTLDRAPLDDAGAAAAGSPQVGTSTATPPDAAMPRGRAALGRASSRTAPAASTVAPGTVPSGAASFPGVPADLLTMLLVARDEDGSGLTDAEVRDEVVTLLLAGHETTAMALTWALHLLAAHPEAQQRVQIEVDRLPHAGDPTAADLASLPVTRATVAEVLRLYPPSWGIARQAIADVRLRGDVGINAGDVVIASPWILHRDPRWWVQPELFAPERWDGFDPRRPYAPFLPFGAGTRRCIGEGFAWTELTLVLATVLRRWSVRPTGPMPRPVASLTLRPGPAAPLAIDARSITPVHPR